MDIFSQQRTNYQEVMESCLFITPDPRHVDISVIIPVHGRAHFNEITTRHIKSAIDYFGSLNLNAARISLTIVEMSDVRQHEGLCKWANYIHIPLKEKKWNKALSMNIAALYGNKAAHFLFHDLDLLVPKDFFVKLYENIKHYTALQCFTGRRVLLLDELTTRDVLLGTTVLAEAKYREPAWGAQGGSIFVNSDKFFEIGGYEDYYTQYSVEDADFFIRLELMGGITSCDNPPIELMHMWHSPANGWTTKPMDYDYYNSYRALTETAKRNFIEMKSEHIKKFL